MGEELEEERGMGEGAEGFAELAMDKDPAELRADIAERWAAAGGDIDVSSAGLRARAESLRLDAQRRFESGEAGAESLGMQADQAEADAAALDKLALEA